MGEFGDHKRTRGVLASHALQLLLLTAVLPTGTFGQVFSAEWTRKVPLDNKLFTPRAGHAAVLGGNTNNSIYVIGGNDRDKFSGQPLLLSLDAMAWSIIGAKNGPEGRTGQSAVVHGSTLLVYGGSKSTVAGQDVSDHLYSLNLHVMEWTNRGKMFPTGQAQLSRRYHSAVAIGRHMYLFGGSDGYKDVGDLYSYDMDAHKWEVVSATGNAPSPRSEACIAALPTGFIVYGGRNHGRELSDLYHFDVGSKEWTMLPAKFSSDVSGKTPDADFRRAGASCAVIGGSFLVWGGKEGTRFFNDFILYHLPQASRSGVDEVGWDKYGVSVQSTEMPESRAGHAMVEVPRSDSASGSTGKYHSFYVFGGQGGQDRYFNDVYRLEIIVDGISAASSSQSRPQEQAPSRKLRWELRGMEADCAVCGAEDASMLSVSNPSTGRTEVLMFGGNKGGWVRGSFSDELHQWDLDRASMSNGAFDKWKKFSARRNPPGGRAGHTMTLIPSTQYALLFGGEDSGFFGKTAKSDPYLLSVSHMDWTVLARSESMPSPRAHHTAVSFAQKNVNGVVIFGGDDTTSSKNDAFFFTTDLTWTKLETVGNVPEPRTKHCSVMDTASGIMYTVGGTDIARGTSFNEVFALKNVDGRSGRWELMKPAAAAPAPSPRYSHNCHLIKDSLGISTGILILGGYDDSRNQLSDAWLFDIDSREWIAVDVSGLPASPQSVMLPSPEPFSIMMIGTRKSVVQLRVTSKDDSKSKQPVKQDDQKPVTTASVPEASPSAPNPTPASPVNSTPSPSPKDDRPQQTNRDSNENKDYLEAREFYDSHADEWLGKVATAKTHCKDAEKLIDTSNTNLQTLSVAVLSAQAEPLKLLAQVEAQADELKKVIDSQLTALRRPREDIDRVGTRIGQIQLTQSTLPREIREAELQEVKLQEELKHLGALGVSLTGKANELDDKWREIRAALHLIDSGESQKDLPQLDAQLKKLNEDRALHQTAVDDTEREIVKLQAKEATARQKLVDHDQKGQSAPSRINKMKDEREVKIASIQSADADAEQLKSQLGALKKDRRITKKKLEAANGLLGLTDDERKLLEMEEESRALRGRVFREKDRFMNVLNEEGIPDDNIDEDDDDDDDGEAKKRKSELERVAEAAQEQQQQGEQSSGLLPSRAELTQTRDALMKRLSELERDIAHTSRRLESVRTSRDAAQVQLQDLEKSIKQEELDHESWTSTRQALEKDLENVRAETKVKHSLVEAQRSALKDIDIQVRNKEQELKEKRAAGVQLKLEFARRMNEWRGQTAVLEQLSKSLSMQQQQVVRASTLLDSHLRKTHDKVSKLKQAFDELMAIWTPLNAESPRLKLKNRLAAELANALNSDDDLAAEVAAFEERLRQRRASNVSGRK